MDDWNLDCEAEYRAWEWAFKQMQSLGVHPGREVFARYDLSLRYAVYQEQLRGVRELPACLTPFIPRAA